MASFIFAINAILPIVLMVSVGYLLRRIGLLRGEVTKVMNKLVFRLLLPTMLFLNIYKIENFLAIDFGFVWYGVLMILALFFISIPIVALVTKRRDRRGVIIQSFFRSNYALIGIPLATSLFGEEGAIRATLLSAFIIPIFNALAVICLTVYKDGERISMKGILLGIVKNPLIQSITLGLLALGIRAILVKTDISFRLTDVGPVYSVLGQLAACATPIALLTLGAEFEFSAIPELRREIIFGTVTRTVIIPAVALTVAYFMGCFGGAHFATFVAMFATPVAVSSVPMAQEMGADSTLAGQLVVFTTIVSAFTVFIITFILKSIGVFG